MRQANIDEANRWRYEQNLLEQGYADLVALARSPKSLKDKLAEATGYREAWAENDLYEKPEPRGETLEEEINADHAEAIWEYLSRANRA